MAFTYLVLNILFLICIVGLMARYLKKPSKAWVGMALILLILTALFDSIIIWAGIVGYDMSKITGVYIGYAPIEDFFYAVLAAILVPALWNRFKPRNNKVETSRESK